MADKKLYFTEESLGALVDSTKSYVNTAINAHASSHAPADAEKNVQSDWNVTDTSSDAYIKNKPNVVLEGDSRLSDPRTPKSHTHTKAEITDFAHNHVVAEITDLTAITSDMINTLFTNN